MAAILWRFQFSTTQAYVIELGNEYMRFYKDGAPVLISGIPYGIVTPYQEADLFQLQYKQINDVVYICHPDYPVYKLSRISDTSWTLAEVEFMTPPTLDENTTNVTITPSATTGTITLTASSAIFDALHVGSYWRIGHLRAETDRWHYIDGMTTAGADLRIAGDWEFHTYGTWNCDIILEKIGLDWAITGAPYEVVRKWTGRGDRNIDAKGTAFTDALYRMRFENYVSNTGARAVLEAVDALIYGVVKITAMGSSGTNVTAEVIVELESTDATTYWQEGAFSAYRGYPRSVTIHEQRLMFGGTAYQPSRIWGSVVGDYENFLRSTDDDASIAFDLAGEELHEIQWLVSQRELLVGTAGGEWVISSQSTEKPLTPTTINARQQSSYGSEYIAAQVVEGVVLFVQRKGRKVRELVYQYDVDKYVAADLTLLAEHVTEGGIVQMAYQAAPIPVLWCVTANGVLAGLTYSREQQVVGWHRHPMDGTVESVTTIYGDSDADDEVWLIVKRNINGVDVRYVERINPAQWTAKADAYFVDCGITYSGASTATITGLSHLNGETVVALYDGKVATGLVVSGGQVTLPAAATKAHVGIAFTSKVKPMRLDNDASLGPILGRFRRIGEMVIRVRNTLAIKFNNGQREYTHTFSSASEATTAATALFSGDSELDFHGTADYDCPIEIIQDKPLPLILQAIVAKIDVTG